MPELPEVEISCRMILPQVTGSTILRAQIRNSVLRYPVSREIALIRNEPILGIERRAKYILMKLKQGCVVVHLGMSGYLNVMDRRVPPGRHDHIDLVLDNDRVIRYTDPRRFGSWLWGEDAGTADLLDNLGVDPLGNEFSEEWLSGVLRHRRAEIKPLLMNPRILVGLGNIYAGESLFLSRILPDRISRSLERSEVNRLVSSIRTILMDAIEVGMLRARQLSRIVNYSELNRKLYVYRRGGLPCYVCGTSIEATRQNQRSTFFCTSCQT